MIKPPSSKILKKYGLTESEWLAILERQHGTCAVCGKVPTSERLNIDHEHVKGWSKMPPEKRRQAVRGLLCWRCNFSFAGKGITIEKSKNVTAYLEEYEKRKAIDI